MNKESSIDQNELYKFNKTSNEWWDQSGEFKILHQISPIRLQYINDKIAEHFNSIENGDGNPKPLKKYFTEVELASIFHSSNRITVYERTGQ